MVIFLAALFIVAIVTVSIQVRHQRAKFNQAAGRQERMVELLAEIRDLLRAR